MPYLGSVIDHMKILLFGWSCARGTGYGKQLSLLWRASQALLRMTKQ